MGKGSVPRPFDVPKDKFNDNWDQIFGKKDKTKPSDQAPDNKAK